MPSKYESAKGFLSFDTLLAFIPILLMGLYIMNYANLINQKNQNYLKAQVLHNKLVSISELTVNDLAATKYTSIFAEASSVKPNWIDENELAKIDQEKLRKDIGLTKLKIGWDAQGNNCIYRIVVFGELKEIRQLYICGE